MPGARRGQLVRARAAFFALVLAGATGTTATAAASVSARGLTRSAGYRTFSLEEATPALREAARQRLTEAIQRGFEAKGLHRVDEKAEVEVVTHVLVDRHSLEDLDRADYFEYWSGVSAIDVFDVQAGTLVIDVVETATGHTVWRGVASTNVKGTPKKTLKRIDQLVDRLLERFPSGP